MRWLRDPRVLVLLVALAVRAGYLATAEALPTRTPFDGYVEMASNILAGRGPTPSPPRHYHLRTPLYPGLIAAVWSVSPAASRFTALAALQAGLSVATCAVIMALVRPVAGLRTAVAAGLLFALSPSAVVYCGLVYTETLHLFLLSLAAVAAARLAWHGRTLDALAFGVLWGLLGLNRPEATYIVPVLALPALLGRAVPASRRLALAGLMLGANALMMAPWVARNHTVYGTFVLHTPSSGNGLYGGSFPYPPMYGRSWAPTPEGDVAYWEMPQYRAIVAPFWDREALARRGPWRDEILARSERDFLEIDARLKREALRQIAANPRLYAWNLAMHAYDLWGRPAAWAMVDAPRAARAAWYLGYLGLLAAVGLGLARLGRLPALALDPPARAVAGSWAGYLAWHTVVLLPMFTEPRYQAACAPFLVALAALGLTRGRTGSDAPPA